MVCKKILVVTTAFNITISVSSVAEFFLCGGGVLHRDTTGEWNDVPPFSLHLFWKPRHIRVYAYGFTKATHADRLIMSRHKFYSLAINSADNLPEKMRKNSLTGTLNPDDELPLVCWLQSVMGWVTSWSTGENNSIKCFTEKRNKILFICKWHTWIKVHSV